MNRAGITTFVLAACVMLMGCATRVSEEQRKREYEERSAQQLASHKAELKRIEEQYTPKDPTPEDLALTKERSLKYYSGLVRSIKAIDDGVTPADSVARAAVSENIDLLRSWKRAQMAHLARLSEWTAQEVETAINGLPSKGLLDEATSIVLRKRAGTLLDRKDRPEP